MVGALGTGSLSRDDDALGMLNCAAARSLEFALVTVAITGTVEYSNLSPPLGDSVAKGSDVSLTFKTLPADLERIAEGITVHDGIGPYPICNETLSLQLGKLKLKMGPAPPAKLPTDLPPTGDTFFSFAKGRPVTDSIFISTAADSPMPLPMLLDSATLSTTTFEFNFATKYKRGTLESTVIKDVAGSYTSDGLLSSTFDVTTNFATGVALRVKLSKIEVSM